MSKAHEAATKAAKLAAQIAYEEVMKKFAQAERIRIKRAAAMPKTSPRLAKVASKLVKKYRI
ncbi:MAG: hypothetical protein HC877_23930 [Thioploca sp.]|nr:hypothetical protein [Thioploca sp.]